MSRQTRPHRGGLTALLCSLLALLAAACGPSGPGREGSRPAPAEPAYLVYAGNTELGRLQVLAAGSGVLRTLPAGVPSPDWGTVYAAVPNRSGTTVTAVDTASGRVLRSLEVHGRFRLPAIGVAGVPDGVSADGNTLVLASAVDAPVSRFAVLSTRLDRAPALVDLAGDFEFDALSPDGSQLYLVEHLAGGDDSYRVRRYDRQAGKLAPEIIVDKRNAGATSMAGYPNTRVTDPRGIWVYTLYRNSEHGPFVHALNAADGFALCLDLPRQGRQDQGLARLWALARDGSSRRLYAVNTALGLVAEINGEDNSMIRAASFPPDRPGGGRRAATGSVALSPDGTLLLAGGSHGVVAISTESLSVAGRYLDGWAVDALAASPDGRRLYALSRARGQLATLDPASGALLGQQPAPDATLLLRVTGA
jgi:DNA-binding beta-propeller fold protein YncE